MRELFVVNHESTPSSLVLRTPDGEEFFLDLTTVDQDTRTLLSGCAIEPGSSLSAGSAAPAAPVTPENEAGLENAGHKSPEPEQSGAARQEPAVAAATLKSASPGSRATRPSTDVLSMRPPEIQKRVRAGASVEELADEMGVAESRVEPFAHPILLERARIAEIAKQAHPVREDGPAKLTVFEILATAFAARGHTLADATWDAYRVKGEPWTVRVTWKAGLSENEALWTLRQSATSPDVLEARNTVAADLTDPDFVQPVRSLTSVGKPHHSGGSGTRRFEAIDSRELDFTQSTDKPAMARPASVSAFEDRGSNSSSAQEDGVETGSKQDLEGKQTEDDFLKNPTSEPKPSKRRRKSATPHWEDVLLGVRTNTKRPRN